MSRKKQPFDFLISTILYSVVCYLIVGWFFDLFIGYSTSWKWLTGRTLDIDYAEVIFASVFGIVLSAVVSVGIKKRWVNRLGQKFGFSDKYGEDSLLMYFVGDKKVNEVHITDFEYKLIYHGIIESYSDQGDYLEIAMKDTTVYDFEAVELYDTPRVYVCRKRDSISIESTNEQELKRK